MATCKAQLMLMVIVAVVPIKQNNKMRRAGERMKKGSSKLLHVLPSLLASHLCLEQLNHAE